MVPHGNPVFNEKWRLLRFFNIAGNWLKITLLRTVATPISSVSSQSALFKIISYMLNVVCDDGCNEIFKEEKQRYRPKLPGLRLPIKTCCVCFNLLQTVHYIRFFCRQYIIGHDIFYFFFIFYIYLNLKLRKTSLYFYAIYITPSLAKHYTWILAT